MARTFVEILCGPLQVFVESAAFAGLVLTEFVPDHD